MQKRYAVTGLGPGSARALTLIGGGRLELVVPEASVELVEQAAAANLVELAPIEPTAADIAARSPIDDDPAAA
jgi:hypothetical protein